MARLALAVAASATCLWSCAGGPPGATGPQASVAVDVYGGIGGPKPAATRPPRRLHVLMDVTASMQELSPAGESHLNAARGEAAQLLYGLREGTEIAVTAFGSQESDACVGAERVFAAAAPERREPVVQRIQDLPSLSEGSLAEALTEVEHDLVADGAATRSRVVVFSDLDGSCGGDLCAAARSLVATGAWLEIVTLGNAVAPSCLADLRPSIDRPTATGFFLPVKPPTFRVVRARSGRERPKVLGEGNAGEGPVAVAAGMVTVVLDLDPPEEIGPFLLEPGEFARVRLLDSFDAAMPTRVWRVERGTQPLSRAFPPAATPAIAAQEGSP